MKEPTNPFIVSGKIPEAYFCDRVEEAAQLLQALTNQLNVVLISARRMGKTSLVDHVFSKEAISRHYTTIDVDILHTTSLQEFIYTLGTAVFRRVASRSDRMRRLFISTMKSLSASFGYDPVQNTPTFDIRLGDITRPEYTIEEIFLFLEKADRHCMVVIDEFQQITKYPEKNVEAILRSHIQKMSNANFVFAGSQRRLMEDMFFAPSRPFYQSARCIHLEAIGRQVYIDFAVRNFQAGGKDIDPEAVAAAYDTLGGVTLYIQRLMKDAYATTERGGTCRRDDVEHLIQDFIAENDSRLRELLAHITEPQKELLYAIQEEQHVSSITSAAFTKKHRLKSPSATQSAAIRLLDDDLITRNQNVYSIADPLLSLWMKRNNS